MRNLSVGLCLLGGIVAQSPLYILGPGGISSRGIGVGDLDGDGHADIAAASPTADGGRGIVRLYSGSSGELLRELRGATDESFGRELAKVGDVDRDGRPDVGVVVWTPSGAVLRLISGANGSVFGNLPLSARLPSSVAGGQDIDGDGASDIAGVVDTGSATVAVVIYSGLTGNVLRSFPGSGRYGWSLAFVGDHDGNGVADLAIGSPGSVELRSSASGALLRTLSGPVEVNFASALDGVVYDQTQGHLSFDGRGGAPAEDLALEAQKAFTQAHLAWLAIETAHREEARFRFELLEAVDPVLAAENDWSDVG